MTGYTTYGTDSGFCSPIGDLTKMEVFEMAEFLNKKFGKEIIPRELLPNEKMEFEIFPSAELEYGQKDPFLFGLDCELIKLVDKEYRENVFSWYRPHSLGDQINYIARCLGIEDKYLYIHGINSAQKCEDRFNHLKSLYENSHFKRNQSPPVISMKTESEQDNFSENKTSQDYKCYSDIIRFEQCEYEGKPHNIFIIKYDKIKDFTTEHRYNVLHDYAEDFVNKNFDSYEFKFNNPVIVRLEYYEANEIKHCDIIIKLFNNITNKLDLTDIFQHAIATFITDIKDDIHKYEKIIIQDNKTTFLDNIFKISFEDKERKYIGETEPFVDCEISVDYNEIIKLSKDDIFKNCMVYLGSIFDKNELMPTKSVII